MIQASAVVNAARMAEMDFFSDTGAGEGLSVDLGSAWSGLTFAVVDQMTGTVIDRSVTGADGRTTLDAEIGASFYLVAEASGYTSRTFVLAAGDVLGLWVAAYVGSPAPVADAPTPSDVTDTTQSSAVEPAGGEVAAAGIDPSGAVALSLPNAGSGMRSSAIQGTGPLAMLLLSLAIVLGVAGIRMTRRT